VLSCAIVIVLSPPRAACLLAAAALLACSNADVGAPRTPESGPPDGGQAEGGTSTGDGAVNHGASGVVITLGPLLPQESWPKTIPSVRAWHEWGAGGAALQLTSQTRIAVRAGASESITRTANVLANDLEALLGTKPTLVEGDVTRCFRDHA
jgi:hypothetical protein